MSENSRVEQTPQAQQTKVVSQAMESGPRKVTRRRFLKGVAVAAGLSLASRLLPPDFFSLGEKPDVVEKIKAFEAKVGDRELDFDELRGYLPLVATLFKKSFDQDPKDITDRTFIIRKEYSGAEPEDYGRRRFQYTDVFSVPDIKQLLSDYPYLKLTKNEAERVIAVLNGGMGRAFFLDGKMMLILGAMSKDPSLGFTPQQYLGIGHGVTCEERTFIVGIRSTYTHEFTHSLVRTKEYLPDKELLKSYQRVEDENRRLIIAKARPRSASERPLEDELKISYVTEGIKGFSLGLAGRAGFDKIRYDWHESQLDELITNYISAKMATKNGLPHSNGNPTDLANIEIVLKQSGIGFDELVDLYRNSRLKDFLLKVVREVKELALEKENENEMLDFAINNFLYRKKPTSTDGVDWTTLSQYFPGITSIPEYEIPTLEQPACLA